MASARIAQVVRPHVPLIKFPSKLAPRGSHGPSSQTNTTVATSQMPASLPETTLAASYQAPIGTTPRGSGIEPNQLPQRFRRKPIDDFEIDFILRGGPEK